MKDAPGAPALSVTRGEVRFEGVRFGYDRDRDILKGIDLVIAHRAVDGNQCRSDRRTGYAYAQLLELRGSYADMWTRQQAEQEVVDA